MAADKTPDTTPTIVIHFSSVTIPAMDAEMDPRKAATEIQNFLLVSLFVIVLPPLNDRPDDPHDQTGDHDKVIDQRYQRHHLQ